MRYINRFTEKFLKFAKVGVFITILSLSLSFLFLKIIKTPLIPTYTLLYIGMILLSFFLNTRYTFKVKMNFSSLFYYYISYLFTMILGIGLLSLFRKVFYFENWILAYMVIPFTLTSNFLLSTYIFKNKKIENE